MANFLSLIREEKEKKRIERYNKLVASENRKGRVCGSVCGKSKRGKRTLFSLLTTIRFHWVLLCVLSVPKSNLDSSTTIHKSFHLFTFSVLRSAPLGLAMAIAAAAVVVPLGLLFFASGLLVNLIQVSLFPFLTAHQHANGNSFFINTIIAAFNYSPFTV